jgi:S-adenosylmethionine-dependent methyltransferase
MTSDNHFEQLSQRFARNIYATDKGQIRLRLLQQDLTPLLAPPKQLILDAGGGQGQLARWCAQQGHQLVLCDRSAQMLEQARHANQQQQLSDRFELIESAIEDFCVQDPRQFDLILCHAVLEWVDDPERLLAGLIQRLKPGGRLSLMFYNRHSIVLRNGLRGNFRKALSSDLSGDGTGLTPTHPCRPEQIEAILQQLQLTIELRAGVRCFYDYLPIKVRQEYKFDDILEMEQTFRHQPPYNLMARYIHLIGHKPQS